MSLKPSVKLRTSGVKLCLKLKLRSAALLTAGALLLTACVSPEEQAAANAIISALPQEAAGCVFLGEVDSSPRATIQTARFELKLKTARLHGTHVVETFAYPQLMAWDYGIALSGRAYRCPEGKGPLLPSPEAQLPSPELPPPPSITWKERWR